MFREVRQSCRWVQCIWLAKWKIEQIHTLDKFLLTSFWQSSLKMAIYWPIWNVLFQKERPGFEDARFSKWQLNCTGIAGEQMDPLLTAAAGGIRSRIESLDILANNLANINTVGFKGDQERYSSYVSQSAQSDPAFDGNSPNVVPDLARQWIDFSQGVVQKTDRDLDIAIAGKGFLSVEGPQGKLYTRNGNLQVKPDGSVITHEGYPVLGKDGKPLKIDPQQAIEITARGEINQQGRSAGQLALFDSASSDGVSKVGNSYFRWSAPPNPINGIDVRQGYLENSNTSPAQSAVRLVSIMRQFETLQKAVTLSTEMNRKAVEEVGRVSS